MDIEKVSKSDRIDPIQPKRNKHNNQSNNNVSDTFESFDKSFQHELEQISEFPTEIAELIKKITQLKSLTPTEIAYISEELFVYGTDLLDSIQSHNLLSEALNQSYQTQLDTIISTLFKIIEEYGNAKPLHYLIEYWQNLHKESPVQQKMEIYFIYLIKQKEFKLSGYKNSTDILINQKEIQSLTRNIQIRIRESLHPYALLPKAKRILSAFNSNNPDIYKNQFY